LLPADSFAFIDPLAIDVDGLGQVWREEGREGGREGGVGERKVGRRRLERGGGGGREGRDASKEVCG